ncbi:hypothetical protein Cob_v003566 [Colletotrichum orbiculare MAFF 240422]|uniref:Uncharacterized protein n=1 Tax=Colletotrichum orbiculare (strain 104-T / ATCC 96160 / CBS 514.97 / LARS 414 / MAFF 240422) TaxID=1213857 RepID=A0A484G212_COLOR|nr:hypothetical protein Cob_v003566 [Colletotrichum orbiculare MAFF 240422]
MGEPDQLPASVSSIENGDGLSGAGPPFKLFESFALGTDTHGLPFGAGGNVMLILWLKNAARWAASC